MHAEEIGHILLLQGRLEDVERRVGRADLKLGKFLSQAQPLLLKLGATGALQGAPPIAKTRLQWRMADIAIGRAGVEATGGTAPANANAP